MSPSDPDLHRAISLRPSPFHIHPDRVNSITPSSPISPRVHNETPRASSIVESQPQPGTSTAIFAESHDTVERPTYHRKTSENDHTDVERQDLPSYNDTNDPYRLRNGYKDIDQEKVKVRANMGTKRSGGCHPLGENVDKVRSRKIIKFYKHQNERIDRMLIPVDEHVRRAREEQGADALQFKIAVQASFIANVLLAILQIYGAVSSGSLSLFTTMADAIFDPCRCANVKSTPHHVWTFLVTC